MNFSTYGWQIQCSQAELGQRSAFDAGAMIHGTPLEKRSQFAKEIWRLRR